MKISRTKFIQNTANIPFTNIIVDTPPYDLLFYWMFYRKSEYAIQFEKSGNKLVREIYPTLQEMPREIQLKLIMKLLKDPEKDYSKQFKSVMRLYKD